MGSISIDSGQSISISLIFFCELFLAIELDGYTHFLDETAAKGLEKEKRLHKLGIRLLRFQDEEVYHNIDNVLRAIDTVVLDQKRKTGS